MRVSLGSSVVEHATENRSVVSSILTRGTKVKNSNNQETITKQIQILKIKNLFGNCNLRFGICDFVASGCSISVVRVFWEHVGWVRFPAPRLVENSNNQVTITKQIKITKIQNKNWVLEIVWKLGFGICNLRLCRLRVSYNGFYNSLPSCGWGFDSPYPLQNRTTYIA